MNQLQEFKDQLVEVERKISEYEQLKQDLHTRIDKLKNQKDTNEVMALNKDQLHKLLCLIEHAVVTKDAVENDKSRIELIEFQHNFTWDIAELLGYDLNEGTIDPETNEFYTFKSRW